MYLNSAHRLHLEPRWSDAMHKHRVANSTMGKVPCTPDFPMQFCQPERVGFVMRRQAAHHRICSIDSDDKEMLTTQYIDKMLRNTDCSL